VTWSWPVYAFFYRKYIPALLKHGQEHPKRLDAFMHGDSTHIHQLFSDDTLSLSDLKDDLRDDTFLNPLGTINIISPSGNGSDTCLLVPMYDYCCGDRLDAALSTTLKTA
jgi:hypothetical protein